MTVAVHLDQIAGRYGGVTALHPLSLDIPAGSRHAIIGPNGAGKSTLLRLIAGTLPPAGGHIIVHGRRMSRDTEAARARRGIGRTFQHPGTIGTLTVADNIRLARHRSPAKVEEILEQVGLAGLAGMPAATLSYGQKRILELGMVLAGDPSLLLLDEPSVGLAPGDITHLTALLTRLPRTVTVLLVEHRLELVYAVADTTTVLDRGQLVVTGPTGDVRADPRTHNTYLHPHGPGHEPTATRPRPSTSRGDILLDVHDLRAGYDGADVLRGLTLTVVGGEIHAILGRNGAGKTTLLNTIVGLHSGAPRGGHIELAGTPLHRPGRARGNPSLAIVAQGRRLYASLTGREHLSLAARTQRAPAARIEQVLELMPALREHLDRPSPQLSGGQQQMLAVAQALIGRPRLLLLDEPSDGLAPGVLAQLSTLLSTLAADGTSVLLAEQNLAFALPLADRFTVLDDGTTRYTGDTTTVDEPATKNRLAELLGTVDGASA